jgi:NAD(P)H-hydrate epimerase
MLFPEPRGEVPWITVEQMVEVDRAMVEDFGIALAQMMENAGRCLAEVARRRFLGADASYSRVTVLAGSGGNGGGAMVCARRLHGWDATVRVALTREPSELDGVPCQQAEILEAIGIPVSVGPPEGTSDDLIIDGIIGYSLAGAPRGSAATMIDWANAAEAPTLSLDVPSGLDLTTGAPLDPCAVSAGTVTLALPKQGLRPEAAAEVVGELYLADIGVPPELYAREPLGIHPGPVFAHSDVVRLR